MLPTHAGGMDLMAWYDALEAGELTARPSVDAAKRFRVSIAPGQRARRLLENRAPEWKDGRTGATLDGPDLDAVNDGAARRYVTCHVPGSWTVVKR